MIKEGYNARTATIYLQKKWSNKGIKVSYDTFYHAAKRAGLEGERKIVGSSPRYTWTQEQLDSLVFYGKHREVTRPTYIPVEVSTPQQLAALEIEIGSELVDDTGLINLLKEKYNVVYTPSSLRQRTRRGVLGVAAYTTSGKRKIPWYPIAQLPYIRFKPSLVRQHS